MKSEEMDEKAIDYIFANITTDRLSTWEKDFVESVSEQWDKYRSLSDKQKEVLGRIWDKQP